MNSWNRPTEVTSIPQVRTGVPFWRELLQGVVRTTVIGARSLNTSPDHEGITTEPLTRS